MLRRPLLLLAGLSAVLSAALQLTVFRHGSLNNDDVAYLLQARTLAAGHLFPPVDGPAEAVQPWFFVPREVGFVSKYLPVVPAVLAVGLVLVGSVVPVLALLAALVPLAVAALAREAGLDARGQLLAAALVALSPLVVVQSGLPLSYVLFLLLVTTGWLLVLRLGRGRAGAGAAVLLGLVATAGAGARPYDAVLLLGPPMLWAAWRRRGDLARLVPALALGAAPVTAAVLAYDARATGSALRLPFALLDPHDAIGFGRRRLAPEDSLELFGPLQGLHGLLLHFVLDPTHWWALGALLVPLAALSWRRSPTAVRVLLVAAAVHLLGYAAFWGPWNYSVQWGRGTRVMGPIYTVPLLVPVVLAGLPALREGARRARGVRALVAVAVVVAVAQLGAAVAFAAVDRSRTDAVLAAADRGRVGGVVRVDVDPPYLGHPVGGLVDGAELAAYAPVPPPGAPVPDLLQLPRGVYGSASAFAYARVHQVRLAGPVVPLAVTLTGRPADVLVVERAGRATACPLRGTVGLAVTPSGTTGCDSAPVPPGWPLNTARRCPDTSCLVLAVYRADDRGALRRRGWRQLQVATVPGGVALVADGEPAESRGSGWLRVAPG